jgi:hypothetical protein
MNINATLLGSLVLAIAGCSDAATGERVDTAVSALDSCIFGTPVITAATAENPGPVAAGIHKIYDVTVHSTDSLACAPATVTFVPDSFHLFTVSSQPTSQAGVGPNGFANFRVDVVSDPSVPEGVTNIGFTIDSLPGGTSVRGSVVYEVNFENPVGCNRQPPQIAVVPTNPVPVASGTPVSYQVTVRNIDNPECGPDTFVFVPSVRHFFTFTANGPFVIAPQGGSAVFSATVNVAPGATGPGTFDLPFTIVGNRHGALTSTGSVRYIATE